MNHAKISYMDMRCLPWRRGCEAPPRTGP